MGKRLSDNLSSLYIGAANRLKPKKARHRIVAYVESYDDVSFWRSVFADFEDETCYFEVMLPSNKSLSKGKKILRKSNEILFEQDGDTLYPYQLSSGEKQLLVILLTVLVQDNRTGVLFMDEPEVSLHVEWQQRLISLIRELNPNVQIVLTTHSPAMIMDGWMDAVTEVSDITV